MAFSSDGRYALVAVGDGQLELQHFADGAVIYSVEFSSMAIAFADYDNCIIVKGGDNRVHVIRRCFPEWWWGHLCRPEVWAAVVIGAAWLWTVVRWIRRRRAAGLSSPPA